jgi:hypothetical protein
MKPVSDEERAAYATVDEALHSYPLRPAPAGLARRVLARLPARLAPPRFRLAWLDYALSLLGAGMAGLALLLWHLVTPPMLARFQAELGLMLARSQTIGGGLWLGLAATGALAALGALLFAALVFSQAAPRR